MVAAVASIAVALLPFRVLPSLVIVNAVVLVMAAVDWWLAPRPSDISVERDLPAVLPLNGQGEVAWQIGNRGNRPVRVAIADELAPSLHAGARRMRLVLPAHASG